MKADPKEFAPTPSPARDPRQGSGSGPGKMTRRVFLGAGAAAVAGGALTIGFHLRKRLHPLRKECITPIKPVSSIAT